MQNKPNLLHTQMNVTTALTTAYQNIKPARRLKNKPNSRKRKMNVNFYEQKDYQHEPPLQTPEKQTQYCSALEIRPQRIHAGPDFALLPGGVTIKGLVKNAAGEPLPLCRIWHSVNGKTLGEVRCNTKDDNWQGSHGFTGRNGEFELVNCPAMKGLAVTVSGVAKCPFWDFKMQNWKMHQPFTVYDEKTVDIDYEPGKNEYYLEIALGQPDTNVEFEIKDADGNAVSNAEVSLNPTYDFQTKYTARTDELGHCILENIPWMKKLQLTVRPDRQGRRYYCVSEIIELTENVDKYMVEVVMPGSGNFVGKNVTVHTLVE